MPRYPHWVCHPLDILAPRLVMSSHVAIAMFRIVSGLFPGVEAWSYPLRVKQRGPRATYTVPARIANCTEGLPSRFARQFILLVTVVLSRSLKLMAYTVEN